MFFREAFGAVLTSSPDSLPQYFLKVVSAIRVFNSSASNSSSLRMRNKSAGLGAQKPTPRNYYRAPNEGSNLPECRLFSVKSNSKMIFIRCVYFLKNEHLCIYETFWLFRSYHEFEDFLQSVS